MPRKKVYVCAWLEPDEKKEVVALARQTNLSNSELMRRLILGRRLPNAHLHRAVLDLMKVNADLARLGNLLRMALADDDLRPPGNIDLETLFESIETTQGILKAKIREL